MCGSLLVFVDLIIQLNVVFVKKNSVIFPKKTKKT